MRPRELVSKIRFALPEGNSLPAKVWKRRHSTIVGLLWLHAAGITVFGTLRGHGFLHSATESSIVAAFGVAAVWKPLHRRMRSAMAVLGLLSSSAILVHLSSGSIEMHFHFFVMVVVIALYQDWVPFLLAIGYVVVHHGTIGIIDPAAVFNHPAAQENPWLWASIHGVFILAASAASLVAWRFTERARAEAQMILNSAGEGIYGIDTAGRATFVNPAAAAMLGYPADELIGRKMHEVTLVKPGDAPPVKSGECPLYQAFEEGKSRVDLNETFYRKDGSSFPVQCSGTPIRERDKIVGTVMTFRDVSGKHELEAQLRQSQKMDAVGQLAGGVAHDFNNLLQVILNYADFLSQDLGEEDPRTADVKAIRSSGERAAKLVSQLLSFSRKELTNPVPLDLSTVIRDMNELLRRTIRSNIEMNADLSSNLHSTLIDPQHVQQLLVNLVVNARDAMPNGGKLTISTGNVEIDEAFARVHPGLSPGQSVCLAVSDTGCGMSEEVRSRVFEPFFTTKPRGSGTGLGLSTVYGIVKAAGGHIAVYSEPELGTVFKVYLPATDQTAVESAPSTATPTAAGRGETVLVAEDEDNVRQLVERILTNNGYHVLAASSGSDALEVSRTYERQIDLLVSDLIMPGMSGRELSAAIAESRPEIPTLYMSGYPDDVLDYHGLADGARYLPKPFTAASLLSKVQEALQAAALEAAKG